MMRKPRRKRGYKWAAYIFGRVKLRFGRSVTDWGIYCCRKIAGSDTWSEHSWSNAVDIHPTNKETGDAVFSFLNHRRRRWNIEHLLWQVPDHFDHLHVDFGWGHGPIPPCAR